MVADTLALHARCRSLFAAGRLLIERGYAEEASILAGSLFESSLRLEYVASQGPVEREALLIQRRIDGISRTEELVEQPHHSDLGIRFEMNRSRFFVSSADS